MTILEKKEIIYFNDDTKRTILNNEKIEDKLHVIMVISNPCNYVTRIRLAKEFIQRMKSYTDTILYTVELVYGDQPFTVTKENNPKHLQLRTKVPLWHKENMINLGVKHLLPVYWKAFAWIDADISFGNVNWASDTLKILNGSKDVVQLFSVCCDSDKSLNTMNFFKSFGMQISLDRKFGSKNEYPHPGFAWAMTRKAYEKVGGLYQTSILGAGDFIMAMSFIANANHSLHSEVAYGYLKSVEDFEKKACNLRLGYVPGTIKHFYHGSKANRKYQERWKLLVDHKFDPLEHLQIDSNGVIQPNNKFPVELIDNIFLYFTERNEDQ